MIFTKWFWRDGYLIEWPATFEFMSRYFDFVPEHVWSNGRTIHIAQQPRGGYFGWKPRTVSPK